MPHVTPYLDVIWSLGNLTIQCPTNGSQELVWRFYQGSAATCITLTREQSSFIWEGCPLGLSTQLQEGRTWNGEVGRSVQPTLAINHGMTDVAARSPMDPIQ